MFKKRNRSWIYTLLPRIGKQKDVGDLEEEITAVIRKGKETGLIDDQSGEMIQSVLDLRQTVVREVIIPRTEIVALTIDARIDEVIDLVRKHGHTRMPVYDGSIDNIVGILNVKDLLQFWSASSEEMPIRTILRKAYYIPETKNIHLLLHELKERKSHMAIVIDEYGGTTGLVTLEDLIEEIVGEIHDEHDIEEDAFTAMPDGTVIVDSRVEIEEFEAYFGVAIPEGNFETLGGYIFHLIKKIPVPGETITDDHFEMTVESADERSIKRVRISRIAGEPTYDLGV